jgi:NAD(P)-dependent dehydrogenase (short-subunit alcohol dehydrogenase family)
MGKAVVAEGARVAITGRDTHSLESARRAIGQDTLAIQSDTADLKAIDTLLRTIREKFGGLDILFANAGVDGITPVEKTTEEEFDLIFDINVKGLFFTVQKALPLLRSGLEYSQQLHRNTAWKNWLLGLRGEQSGGAHIRTQLLS